MYDVSFIICCHTIDIIYNTYMAKNETMVTGCKRNLVLMHMHREYCLLVPSRESSEQLPK